MRAGRGLGESPRRLLDFKGSVCSGPDIALLLLTHPSASRLKDGAGMKQQPSLCSANQHRPPRRPRGSQSSPPSSSRPGCPSIAMATSSLSNAPPWRWGGTRPRRDGSEAERLPVQDGGGDGGSAAAAVEDGGAGAAYGRRNLRADKGRDSVLTPSNCPWAWRLTGLFLMQVADELVKVQVALSNIAGKRERIKILFKKIEDVIKYLDPQYIDRMAVPDTMKLQFILAEEQSLPSRVALLEQVKNLEPILDSASIQAAPEHAAKIQRLSQIQIQQQEQCEQFTDEVKMLLENYNKTTLLLSKQFVQWNEILTQLEAAREVKPAAE
uniref:Dynactin subunit 3 n=1 Tax=Coturnix japonica TaxID=93934 RepID=A0A8C2SZ88_COTJA